MTWWPLGRSRREPAAGAAPATPAVPPMIDSAKSDGAWRDLPAVQRTLADPLHPVAINDDFRDSLASYANPSLAAPLTHQVDPQAGGLVEGLVSPGVSYAHSSGPEPIVPSQPQQPVVRTGPSTGSGRIDVPPVQRSVISSGTADVPTVPLELPETGYSAPEFQLPASSEDSAPVAEAGLSSETSTPAGIPASRPTFASDAPPIEGASTRRWGVEDASMGEPAATPMTSAREVPVVARSVDPSLGAEASRPPRSTESVVQPVRVPESATASPELPVVSRSAEPAAESAPLSGFAEAITKLTAAEEVPKVPGEAATRDHHTATHDHHAASDAGHSAQSALPHAVQVQRHSTEDRRPSTEPDLPVVAPSASPAAPSDSPPVSRFADAGSAATEEIKHPKIETQSDTPTLGVRLTQAPLTLQRTPVTERVSAPLEPVVQRVEFLPLQVAQDPRPNTASAASYSVPSSTPTAAPEPPAPTQAVPTISAASARVQRLPSQDAQQGSNSPATHPFAVSRRETQVSQAIADAPLQRQESLESATSTPAAVSEHMSTSAMQSEFSKSQATPVADYLPTQHAIPAAPVEPTATHMPVPHEVREMPVGPAVVPEPWTPAPRIPDAQAPVSPASVLRPLAPTPSVPATPSALPTVSRLADAPTYPTTRSASSSRTVAVGPAIPRASATATFAESPPAVAMSFSSMFGSAQSSETGSPAEDGFTSVQLQPASESGPSAAEPAADAAATAAPANPSSGSPPPAAGTKPTELDELARRLYEPLAARLRAELWLDRERAGVMTDG
jgi:hypothetical protein